MELWKIITIPSSWNALSKFNLKTRVTITKRGGIFCMCCPCDFCLFTFWSGVCQVRPSSLFRCVYARPFLCYVAVASSFVKHNRGELKINTDVQLHNCFLPFSPASWMCQVLVLLLIDCEASFVSFELFTNFGNCRPIPWPQSFVQTVRNMYVPCFGCYITAALCRHQLQQMIRRIIHSSLVIKSNLIMHDYQECFWILLTS